MESLFRKKNIGIYGRTDVGFRSIVLREQRAIYVPIPKVACTSLKKTFLEALNLPKSIDKTQNVHSMPLPYIEKDELVKLDGYWKFVIVRNPYERLVSCYHSKIKEEQSFSNKNFELGIHKQFLKYGCFKAGMTFSEFVYAVYEIPDSDADSHFKSQCEFATSDEGNLRVNFVGRFENLEEDFYYISHRIGLPELRLSHVNRSDRRRYQDYYDSKLIDKVNERYEKDLKIFEYQF